MGENSPMSMTTSGKLYNNMYDNIVHHFPWNVKRILENLLPNFKLKICACCTICTIIKTK